jgi:hypothetical protein
MSNTEPEPEPLEPEPDTITVTTEPEPEPEPAPPTRGRRRQARTGEEPQVFTTEDVERIRTEERSRYTKEMERADALDAELARYRQADDDRVKAEAKAQKEAERAARKKEEEEMELRQLLDRKEAEWQQKLDEERQAREQAFAMVEQERRHASLQTYLAQRMAEVGDGITPELRDLVAGNTPEEVDQSIALLVQKSEELRTNVMNGYRQANSTRPTVGVTAPPVGPVETSQTSRTYTADELKAMSPEEYAAERESLLRAASQSRRQ